MLGRIFFQGMSLIKILGLAGVMFALADQPFIDSQTINHLIEAFGTHNKGIIIPIYQGRGGHPVIFAIKYKEELLRLKGDIGGREIIARHPNDILEVAVNCEGILIDIDTVESYNLRRDELRQKYSGGKS